MLELQWGSCSGILEQSRVRTDLWEFDVVILGRFALFKVTIPLGYGEHECWYIL